jgi:peptidyl-tRNA hydrolase, PTH1 family
LSRLFGRKSASASAADSESKDARSREPERSMPMASMRIIVGLGNPGPEYEQTPHNMGFLAIDALAARSSIRVTRPEAKSLVGRGEIAGQQVVLAKPQTMMNLSGLAVRQLLEKYEGDPENAIVLVDDVDLPWGMLRIKERGSAGTHNGMKSVVQAIGTEFVRIRLGVGPEKVWGELRDYVLRPMNRSERETAEQTIADAVEAVEMILADGPGKAMARFNRRVSPADAEGSE